MVEEGYVKEVAGGAYARCLPDVIQAGASLAGRMVVEDDDRGGVIHKRPLHDGPGVDKRGRESPFGQHLGLDQRVG